ncbi:MAG TPA: Ig-like domain-containing protein, partial [Marmoricola sp.]|nr:Ig-like domain-containing protein [Marmoricola sp.]
MTLPRRSLSAMAVSITMVGSIGVAGCSVSRGSDGAPTPDNGSPSASSSPTSAATVKVNVRQGADSVKVDKVVTVTASQGTLSDVTMRTRKGRTIKGALSDDKTVWTAKERLEPNTGYRVRATAADSAGLETSATTKFRSAD